MTMSFKEWAGKRVRTDYGNINGHDVKLTSYERDVIMERLYTLGFTINDFLGRPDWEPANPLHEMNCNEFKEFAEFAEALLD